ncbi:MAG: hypothetical protein PsegKO_02330 [Pseudohongiellaceae bacterium]|jgi:hypothetical protein
MIERRHQNRVAVDYWASLKHPLLGTMTANVSNLSVSGVALVLDEEVDCFVMMELDVRIHGDGWDDSMPALPVQVVRVQGRQVALRFLDSHVDELAMPIEQQFGFSLADTGDIALRM